jgi:hypothetical protein
LISIFLDTKGPSEFEESKENGVIRAQLEELPKVEQVCLVYQQEQGEDLLGMELEFWIPVNKYESGQCQSERRDLEDKNPIICILLFKVV